ncbi:hypothetical protein UlMin_036710 [Ulmus minor]
MASKPINFFGTLNGLLKENSKSSLVSLFSSSGGASMFSHQHVDSYHYGKMIYFPLVFFVATWNVGGVSPHNGLNLDDFFRLIIHQTYMSWVLEDDEPTTKWLALVNQSLNEPSKVAPRRTPSVGGSLFFTKPLLKKVSKSFRTESKQRLKAYNCPVELEKKHSKDFCCSFQQSNNRDFDFSSEEDDDGLNSFVIPSNNYMKYSLVASKQMVGMFHTIWISKELVQYVSHLRTCCISCRIMGCLGNKRGMKLEEIRMSEILRNTQFPKICKTSIRVPDRILKHDCFFKVLKYVRTLKKWDCNACSLRNWCLSVNKYAGRLLICTCQFHCDFLNICSFWLPFLTSDVPTKLSKL